MTTAAEVQVVMSDLCLANSFPIEGEDRWELLVSEDFMLTTKNNEGLERLKLIAQKMQGSDSFLTLIYSDNVKLGVIIIPDWEYARTSEVTMAQVRHAIAESVLELSAEHSDDTFFIAGDDQEELELALCADNPDSVISEVPCLPNITQFVSLLY